MDLRELQLYKLDILKEITHICDLHEIKYYLSGGTMLGCIRHNGFIPWDDDVDIALQWNDYLVLLEIIQNEYSDKYFVQNLWTEKEYSNLFTQIRVNGTTSMPVNLQKLNIHWGICIDVFPLIAISDDNVVFGRQVKGFERARALLAKELMRAKGEKPLGAQKVINYNFPNR